VTGPDRVRAPDSALRAMSAAASATRVRMPSRFRLRRQRQSGRASPGSVEACVPRRPYPRLGSARLDLGILGDAGRFGGSRTRRCPQLSRVDCGDLALRIGFRKYGVRTCPSLGLRRAGWWHSHRPRVAGDLRRCRRIASLQSARIGREVAVAGGRRLAGRDDRRSRRRWRLSNSLGRSHALGFVALSVHLCRARIFADRRWRSLRVGRGVRLLLCDQAWRRPVRTRFNRNLCREYQQYCRGGRARERHPAP
jgi:hypothetical protein